MEPGNGGRSMTAPAGAGYGEVSDSGDRENERTRERENERTENANRYMPPAAAFDIRGCAAFDIRRQAAVRYVPPAAARDAPCGRKKTGLARGASQSLPQPAAKRQISLRRHSRRNFTRRSRISQPRSGYFTPYTARPPFDMCRCAAHDAPCGRAYRRKREKAEKIMPCMTFLFLPRPLAFSGVP